MNKFFGLATAFVLTTVLTTLAGASDSEIIVQSTTSTANSGLYEYLLPVFAEKTGITAKVVAVGTGQAIRNAENCDADVLLVHARAAEEIFVAKGYGVKRFDLMYNDFVIVGPAADPANLTGSTDAALALKVIAKTESLFASRGDDSGTHKAERRLWAAADVDPDPSSGQWYRETGGGMGATLNIAVGMGAYVMTDRATWISFKNKSDFRIIVEGDEKLFNQYGVILVDGERCTDVNAAAGQRFVDWLLSKDGQDLIQNFIVNGQQLFFPNASID